MSKLVRIGVAGAGVFGGFHASKIHDHPGAMLGGIFDADAGRAGALAERFGARAFSDLSKFLDAVDAVIVAAPASVHFDLAHAALSAGKHVFVEKPITLNLADADALIGLARARDLILQTGHQERYVADAAGLFARDVSPAKIDCVRRTAASGRCEDVSVVLDLMIHDLDLVRRLTKTDLVTAEASGGAHEAAAKLMLGNGTIVSLRASRRADAPERRMTMTYGDGDITFDFVTRELTGAASPAIDADNPPLAFRDPLAFGADRFISAINTGETPFVSGEDGRAALAWALAIENAVDRHAQREITIKKDQATRRRA
ncbi:MAG: Gfo/Idh/MocA family oxidoreductase [Parvularculaceae bacterium]